MLLLLPLLVIDKDLFLFPTGFVLRACTKCGASVLRAGTECGASLRARGHPLVPSAPRDVGRISGMLTGSFSKSTSSSGISPSSPEESLFFFAEVEAGPRVLTVESTELDLDFGSFGRGDLRLMVDREDREDVEEPDEELSDELALELEFVELDEAERVDGIEEDGGEGSRGREVGEAETDFDLPRLLPMVSCAFGFGSIFGS